MRLRGLTCQRRDFDPTRTFHHARRLNSVVYLAAFVVDLLKLTQQALEPGQMQLRRWSRRFKERSISAAMRQIVRGAIEPR